MWLGLPAGNVSLDEVEPYLTVSTDDMGGVDFKLMLRECGQWKRVITWGWTRLTNCSGLSIFSRADRTSSYGQSPMSKSRLIFLAQAVRARSESDDTPVIVAGRVVLWGDLTTCSLEQDQ